MIRVAGGALASALLAGWAIGRVASDRTLLTQFVSWVPVWVWLLAALFALAARSIARLRAPRFEYGAVGGPSKPVRGRMLSRALVAVTAIALVHAAVFEYRLFSGTPDHPLNAGGVRLLAWNPASGPIADLASHVASSNADVIAVANSSFVTDWQPVMQSLGPAASAVRSGRMVLCSRVRITEWGATSLKVTGAKERTFKWTGGQKVSVDEGYAVYCVLQLNERETFTVWFLDLPSDPGIPRARMMREARATIDGFRGPRYRRNSADDRDELIAGGVEGTGFPKADVAVGDFNTPRGSATLGDLAIGMTHAYDQAGRGVMATWPRATPLLAIDHVFVGEGWRASKYAIMDFGSGEHLSQWCELTPDAR